MDILEGLPLKEIKERIAELNVIIAQTDARCEELIRALNESRVKRAGRKAA